MSNDDTLIDVELQALLDKYKTYEGASDSPSTSELNVTPVSSVLSERLSSKFVYEISSSDDENIKPDIILKSLSDKYVSIKSSLNHESDDGDGDDAGPIIKRKRSKNDVACKNNVKERAQKKLENEREKELKKVMKASSRNLKPEEYVEFTYAMLDPDLLCKAYAVQIKSSIETLGAKCKIESQTDSNVIRWKRKNEVHFLNEQGKQDVSVSFEEENQILLIATIEEIDELIGRNNLVAHIVGVKSMYQDKRLSLAIYGMEHFFRNKRKSRSSKLSKSQLEFALTELQLVCNCWHRFVENPTDLGNLVANFTKSVAQIPYKLEKREKYASAEWYITGDNKDCVRVDKDGNGLQRLYQQTLTTFPLARIETAEAIMSKYPTMSNLFEAYDGCSNNDQKEQLLQEIPIRRAAGLMANNVRKVGPELSRKISNYFNGNGDDYI